jgi:hypothetical protein
MRGLRHEPSADPLLMFAIPGNRLGEVVTSLADENNAFAIIGAIDRVIRQGYP